MYRHNLKPAVLLLLWVIIYNTSNAQAPAFATTISNCFGGSLQEEFFGGSECLDGGYLLTGLTNSIDGDISMPVMLDTANIFVVKCDSQGNKEWAKTFGGNDYDKARFGMQDADSNYIIVGTTHSTDGDITFTHGNSELFVLKLNPAGDKIWMKQYGGTGYESGRYVTQLPDGNYMITGYTASHNFDVPPPGHGGHDGWLLKIDTSGTIIWSKTYGGSAPDRIRNIVGTPDGGYIFSGSSESNDFDCVGGHGGADFWVGKVDSVGNLLWSKLFGGSGEDYAYHIIYTAAGNCLATGYTESGDGDVVGHMGDSDGWIITVDDQGVLLNQKCFGGSGTDRLYKSYETSQGEIITAGFSQSSDFDLAGINAGPSNAYWLMMADANFNSLWGYTTGGSAADLGKELIFHPADSSVVIMGDSNSGNGTVLGNHGDFDYWIIKLDLFTSLPQEPAEGSISVHYDAQNNLLIIDAPQSVNVDIVVNEMSGKNVLQLKNVSLQKGNNTIELNAMKSAAGGMYAFTLAGSGINVTSKFANVRK